MKLIKRTYDQETLARWIGMFPVTAMLGPRQCGKTTLARAMHADHYFDLENPRDAARLDQPQLALEDLKGLVAIDEIQRMPELFPCCAISWTRSQTFLFPVHFYPPSKQSMKSVNRCHKHPTDTARHFHDGIARRPPYKIPAHKVWRG
jgi:hypothetical protein